MTARWWDRFRATRRTVIGLSVLGLFTVACILGAVWRASWIVNRLLREWAAGTIAERSDGVYQVELGHVRFDWALRRVALDSISLSTRRAVNARRPQPLPGLRLALYSCTISGVHFVTLVRNAGLIASSFGCRQGSLMVEVPRSIDRPISTDPDPPARTFAERQTFLVFQQGVRLPAYAPRVRIAQVVFPRLALDVRLPRTARGVTRFELERLQWRMTDLAIDPTDTMAAARPLFSRSVEMVADNFTTYPNHDIALRVGLLRTSLTDSTLEIRGVGMVPIEAGPAAGRRYRRDLITLTADHITAQGIDVGAFVLGHGVRARRIDVDSFRIDVISDKRLLDGAPGPPHRTPQQWIADLDETLSLDSLLVRNGEVVYREHVAGRARPGVITFARIEAAGANVSHFVGRRTGGDPMTLTARAHLQGAGRLDVQIVVPLDAPQFDMSVRGTLGPMPASALNPFVEETAALHIKSGQVAGVDFNVTVKNGVSVGRITPRFGDLSVLITRSGSNGILGGGGMMGGTARHVASIAATLMLHADNPDRRGTRTRSGTIRHTFSPDETLVAFLWSGARDGLLQVVKR